MDKMERGDLVARLADGPADVARALALRARVFRGGRDDEDAFDPGCTQVLIERAGRLDATFRLQVHIRAESIVGGYAGQRYDLRRLAGQGGAMVEMGRLCADPQARSPDLLRLAWAAVARMVLKHHAGFLFGCTSFAGTAPQDHAPALGHLAATALAPAAWAPGIASAGVFPLTGLPPPDNPARALASLPPLLRAYLALGGRVSDHAVIDHDLGTFHLFTGVEIAAIPAPRAATLRDLAG